MEHEISALIFPETDPSLPGMAKLLLFFDALSYYRPTEAGESSGKGGNFLPGLVMGYAPAPLGDDLARFSRLLREMETSGPDEFSRLFSTAKTTGAAGQVRDQDEVSAGTVYTALHKDAGEKAAIRHKERLWQARLILKLAEMLNSREAEVRQGLAQVSRVEQKLFATLAGPGQDDADIPAVLDALHTHFQPKADITPAAATSPGTSGLFIPQRVKAWSELYLADSSDPLPLILAAANPESGGLLLDGYENTWRRKPKKLFTLAIPALHPAAAEETLDAYLSSRASFRRAVRDNLEYLAGFLRKTAAGGATPENRVENPLLLENITAWEEKMNDHFPGPGKNMQELEFYSFPGVSNTKLLQRLFHLQGPVEEHKQKGSTGIVAILNS